MTSQSYREKIQKKLNDCLTETNLTIGKKYQGKVRDTYALDDRLILITTDRLSAFDRILAAIPYKGQVLNGISAWWFEKTKHIIRNALLAVPHPNITIAKKCDIFPIEFVVRGYITGSTSTALWTHYQKGVREYCGHPLSNNLRKNQRLPIALLTPTTKEMQHDRPISAHDIIKENWMTESDFHSAAEAALKLYQCGTEIAATHGLILVDTKYEFGKDSEGQICLVDEIHTPDSSRYWLADTYQEKFAQQHEPDNIDKEFLRLWFTAHCDPYKETILPSPPEELIITLAERYIALYEKITGRIFDFSASDSNKEMTMEACIRPYLVADSLA